LSFGIGFVHQAWTDVVHYSQSDHSPQAQGQALVDTVVQTAQDNVGKDPAQQQEAWLNAVVPINKLAKSTADTVKALAHGDSYAAGQSAVGVVGNGAVIALAIASVVVPVLAEPALAMDAVDVSEDWGLAQFARGACGDSFDGQTLVAMADGRTEPIKDIQIGDEVLATDPSTGKTTVRQVTALHLNEDTDLADLAVITADGSAAILHTTQHHLFWDDTRGTWIEAINLQPGDRLHTLDGQTETITAVRPTTRPHPMYNLTVDTDHTYYVVAGTTPVLVHNCGGNAMSSAIGDDSFLTKAAQQAGRNQRVQQEMDGLFSQLNEGNMDPGLGTKSLSGTDVSYARGRNGARLFFRNVDGGIQIVGKADKGNESAVIRRLTELYGK
jgi:hypothetical protein